MYRSFVGRTCFLACIVVASLGVPRAAQAQLPQGCLGASLDKVKFGFAYYNSVVLGSGRTSGGLLKEQSHCGVQETSAEASDAAAGDTNFGNYDVSYSMTINPGQFSLTQEVSGYSHGMHINAIYPGAGAGVNFLFQWVDTITPFTDSMPIPTAAQLSKDQSKYTYYVDVLILNEGVDCTAQGDFTYYSSIYTNAYALSPMTQYGGANSGEVYATNAGQCPKNRIAARFLAVNGWKARLTVSSQSRVLSNSHGTNGPPGKGTVSLPGIRYCLVPPSGSTVTISSESGYSYSCAIVYHTH